MEEYEDPATSSRPEERILLPKPAKQPLRVEADLSENNWRVRINIQIEYSPDILHSIWKLISECDSDRVSESGHRVTTV